MKLKYPKKDATKQPSEDIDWFNPLVHWSPVKNPSVIGKRKQLRCDWNAIIGSTFLPSVVFKKERIRWWSIKLNRIIKKVIAAKVTFSQNSNSKLFKSC